MAKRRRSPTRKTKSRRRDRRKSGLMAKLPWRFLGKSLLVLMIPTILGVVYLDYVVRVKFEGKKWALPARVYARPLELYAGRNIKPAHVIAELNALGYQSAGRVQKPGQFRQSSQALECCP